MSEKDCRVAVVAMAKCENRYLDEWISYHLKKGFSHIFLYDNNEIDGEHVSDVTDRYKDSVTVIDYRGRHQTSCQVQVEAYTDCYRRYAVQKDYDWLLVCDCDEFFVTTDHSMSVQDYLSLPIFKKANDIRINWKCYSDDGKDFYEDKPVMERFTIPSDNVSEDRHYKNIIRTGLSGLSFPNVHYCSQTHGIVDSEGKALTYTRSTTLPGVTHTMAYIAHYCTKSMEEYVTIKKARRSVGGSKTRLNPSFYWKYNRRTEERAKRLEELLGEKEKTKESKSVSVIVDDMRVGHIKRVVRGGGRGACN